MYGSMIARQTTFGTVAEKRQFFKGLPCADDNAGYYAVLFIVCVINTFLPTKQGVGGWVWATLKNSWIEKVSAFTAVP